MRAPISGHGPRWQLKHVNLPTVPTGMVRVRVIAAGINRADFYKLDGTYGASPTTGTFAAEVELADILETADPAAPHLPVGSPVMGVTVGAFADYALSGHRQPDVKAQRITSTECWGSQLGKRLREHAIPIYTSYRQPPDSEIRDHGTARAGRPGAQGSQ
jgi:hypothetical protein